ncbi:MAG: hypothetical protein H7122_05575 [Chitinophagaceae bacterium]|nr:hypothetical protein [Chitinophagaceae bacterium]
MRSLKSTGFLFLLLSFLFQSSAQSLSAADKKQFSKKEDSLRLFADSMINSESPAIRFRADSNFVRGLVRALKIRNSFSYPFDSLQTVSRLYSPDSLFRIFTWQMKKDEYVLLQKGAIQMKTSDGSLKLFPLFDASMFTGNPQDSVRTRNNWIGAIYYRMIMKEHNGKKYYTLLGFDDFSVSSNKKWMEVLSFNANGEPVFGGPFISFKDDSAKKPVQTRFNIEYKKEAGTVLNYNPELDMIIFDHLISETDEPEKKDTYIPDGDFEGFKWISGQWVHVNKIFDFKLEDGAFPKDATILDDAGNIDEKQLEEASQRNIDRKNPPKKEPAKKKPTPVKKMGSRN